MVKLAERLIVEMTSSATRHNDLYGFAMIPVLIEDHTDNHHHPAADHPHSALHLVAAVREAVRAEILRVFSSLLPPSSVALPTPPGASREGAVEGIEAGGSRVVVVDYTRRSSSDPSSSSSTVNNGGDHCRHRSVIRLQFDVQQMMTTDDVMEAPVTSLVPQSCCGSVNAGGTQHATTTTSRVVTVAVPVTMVHDDNDVGLRGDSVSNNMVRRYTLSHGTLKDDEKEMDRGWRRSGLFVPLALRLDVETACRDAAYKVGLVKKYGS